MRIRSIGIASRIVIQRSEMEHDIPMDGTFTARSHIRDPNGWRRFLKTLEKRGRARLTVHALLEFQGAVAGQFQGAFVAIIPGPDGG